MAVGFARRRSPWSLGQTAWLHRMSFSRGTTRLCSCHTRWAPVPSTHSLVLKTPGDVEEWGRDKMVILVLKNLKKSLVENK